MIKEQTKEYMRTQEIDQKIEETVKEAVTASVQYAMRAPLPYEALQTSILRDESEQFNADKSEERKKIKSKQDSPKTPPGSPPPPPSGASWASSITGGSDSAQDPLPPPPFEPSTSSIPEDVFMHEELDFAALDMVFDDDDIGSRHILRVNLKQDWFKPLSEDDRPETPEPAWSIPSSSLSVPTHNWASAIASSYVPPPKNSAFIDR
ncbi:hypothetical protein Tco_1543671 [Tanacetum coccineum]